ncbi:g10137 [Coccomyxa elongata]|nr:probable diphthamide biosynthesis protein 3 [Coccomyxa sp. Obi]
MGLYDEVEIEDMEWNEELEAFTYSCPCGDLFQITLKELAAGEDIARCPSCSLYVQVIYDEAAIAAKCGGRNPNTENKAPAIPVA